MTRRRGPLLALGAVLLVALAPSAHAAQSKCQKLDATHDLAPAKRVKLVERKNDGGGKDLVGCVLPDGRLTTVASSGDESGEAASYEVRQVAGHHVLVDQTFEGDSGHSTQTKVTDLKRRRWYSVASFCDEEICNDNIPTDEVAARALINSSGQAAAVVRSASSDLVTVDGFSPRGTKVELDSGTRSEISPSSLKLDGHVASWKHNGVRRSARLPSVTECQKLRAKHDLAGARKVKLVERENADSGTDLVGCVLPAGKVSVLASSAKTAGLERSYKLVQVVGHQVLLRGDAINQYGHGVSTYVFDLKRARSYTIAESCFDEHGAACDQTYARRAFVNAKGQAAALVRTDGSSKLQVLGFKSTGEPRVLDAGTRAQIPASSLSLEGHVVRWTHSGAAKSATLSG